MSLRKVSDRKGTVVYDKTDPRSALSTPAGAPAVAPDAPIAAPTYAEFDEPPAHRDAGAGRTWAVRGQNFVLARSVLEPDDALERAGQDHEYVLLLTDAAAHVVVEAGGERRDVAGVAVVIVPPGPSVVRAVARTDVIRLFDHRSVDVAAIAVNAGEYAEPHARVAPLEPWPAPPDGDRLRVYRPEDVPAEQGRFGRIYRTRSFMINYLYPFDGPRSPHELSPHHHDDFQQCSLAVHGEFEHHIRTPWTPDMDRWRPDEHVTVGSPSATIIPPPTVHTTRASGGGHNQLIDIFSPPRTDFSERPGWVLNAADYPAPWEVAS